MAKIVGGIGTSHSPQLSMPPEDWGKRAEWDRTTSLFSFAEAVQDAPMDIDLEITPEMFAVKHKRCQAAIKVLHQTYVTLKPDVVIVVGDDQSELFSDGLIPTFAIYTGQAMIDSPRPIASLHASSVAAEWAYHGIESVSRPGQAELGIHLITSLQQEDFDVAQLSHTGGQSVGHAFTFIHRRIMVDPIVSLLPVMVNTDHSPNIPSTKRCWDFGVALRRAIDSWPSDLRVLLVASGGLTHFVVDRDLDQKVLQSLATADQNFLVNIPKEKLLLGSSEIRNWIIVGAALASDFSMEVIDYIPAYRSEAATGVGMGFVVWHP